MTRAQAELLAEILLWRGAPADVNPRRMRTVYALRDAGLVTYRHGWEKRVGRIVATVRVTPTRKALEAATRPTPDEVPNPG